MGVQHGSHKRSTGSGNATYENQWHVSIIRVDLHVFVGNKFLKKKKKNTISSVMLFQRSTKALFYCYNNNVMKLFFTTTCITIDIFLTLQRAINTIIITKYNLAI